MRFAKFIITTILITTLCAIDVYAFDVDGLKDGMTRDEILQALSIWNFDRIDDRGTYLSAYDIPDKKTYRHYNLSFVNNKLVLVQKDYKPSMKNYIALFQELAEKYGEKVICHASSRMSTEGDVKEIECWWWNRNEEISLRYTIFENNDQLSVVYRILMHDIKKKK